VWRAAVDAPVPAVAAGSPRERSPMTLWSSIITVLVFSFVVIGIDEYWHWLRRRRKQREQGKDRPKS
jgi:hypothetical protein